MIEQGPENTDRTNLNDQVPGIKEFDWLSAGQFWISLIIGILFLGTALISSLALVINNSEISPFLPDPDILSSYLFSAGLGLGGLLMIPSVYYSGRHIFGSKQGLKSDLQIWKTVGRITMIFPILILAGYFVQSGPDWIKILLPLFHIAANGSALFWLLSLVHKGMPAESAQRFWGAFGTGLSVIPVLTFIIELLMLIILGLIWILFLQSQPDLMQELLDIVSRLQPGNVGAEIMQQSMDRFISLPGISATIFFYIAVLIPVVEEILKPAALWLLIRRKITPREGFLAGAAAGAGYALFENLTIGAVADVWTFVMISRLGTAAVHILASGMVGWGIASAGTEKKYFRLLGAYIAAVSIHGGWNGLNILTSLAQFGQARSMVGSFGSYFADYAPAGLLILALGSLIGIIRANSYFRRAIITQSN